VAIITTYATLQTAIGDYLNRADLTSFLPNFTQACEMKLYRDLRIRAMETALSVTISSGVATIPTSPALVQLKYAYVDGSPITSLDHVPPDVIYAKYPNRSSSAEIPRLIAMEGTNFIFGPYPGNYTIKGIYYARLTPLSASNTTNWFTTNATDALLYGSLLEAAPFLADDPRVQMWKAAFDIAVDSIKKEEVRSRNSGGSIAARLG
jgi:hypothetical protein